MTSLQESYRNCAKKAREAASSFYWTFWMLPPRKRRAMCALYAFSRHTDDLADSDAPLEIRQANLVEWRASFDRALLGQFDDPLFPAVVDTLHKFSAPAQYLFDIITGVEMDLRPGGFRTFEDLSRYCYHVASAVGLACIHIWGFRSRRAFEPAVQCGLAFQMTNILRDLKEDIKRGRVYLPQEDLDRFHYSREELALGLRDQRWRRLISFQIERTEQLYRAAAPLAGELSRDGRRIFKMMWATYSRLLEEIKRRDGDVFSERIRLRWPTKALIATGLFL